MPDARSYRLTIADDARGEIACADPLAAGPFAELIAFVQAGTLSGACRSRDSYRCPLHQARAGLYSDVPYMSCTSIPDGSSHGSSSR
jgi:hypothetical protein